MTKSIFLLMCWILAGFVSIIEANEKRFIVDGTYFETLTALNPFQSRLPRQEKRTEERPEVKPVGPPPSPMPPAPKPVVAEPAPVEKPVVPEELPPREEPLPPLTITGMVWNTDRPQAIVNGLVVNVGDEIAGVKILTIRKNGIDVSFSGRTVTLQP